MSKNDENFKEKNAQKCVHKLNKQQTVLTETTLKKAENFLEKMHQKSCINCTSS